MKLLDARTLNSSSGVMADEEGDVYEHEFEDEDEQAEAPAPDSPALSERAVSAVSDAGLSSPLAVPASRQSDRQSSAPSPSLSSVVSDRSRRAKPSARKPTRSVLDQSPWRYSVHAKRVRSLRVPVSAAGLDAAASVGFPVIRDLRVFGVIDKQPVQSHGSRWRQEARIAEARHVDLSGRRGTSPSRAKSPGRRSGVMEEAYWRQDEGELRWKFALDRFRRLKAYSPRIKLFVFGIGANANADTVRSLSEESGRRHTEAIVSLGWFFLDLRTPDLPERWFKLQNSPFGGEILVSTTFAPAEVERGESAKASVPDRTGEHGAVQHPPRLHFHESGDDDCLKLGDSGDDVFLVSVFIKGASNLEGVVRSAIASKDAQRAAMKSGFWLSYSLFDVIVQTDLFRNLDRAEFAPIRDSFRIKSSVGDLCSFLRAQEQLSVYLCTEDAVLANVDLLLLPLLQEEGFLGAKREFRSNSSKVTTAGTFLFGAHDGGVTAAITIEWVKQAAPTEGLESKEPNPVEVKQAITESKETITDASTKVSDSPMRVTVNHVKLSLEALSALIEKEAVEVEILIGDHAVRCPIRFNAFTADHALGDCPELALDIDSHSLGDASNVSVSCFSSITDKPVTVSSPDQDVRRIMQNGGRVSIPMLRDGRLIGECVLNCEPVDHTTSEEQHDVHEEPRSIPGLSHTYRVFIRLKSLRDFETSRPIVISYTNPFTRQEIVETQPISVVKKAEVGIANSYCLFQLHLDESAFKNAMDLPIVMDVTAAHPDGSRELIGTAIFSLNFLYYSEEQTCCTFPGCDSTFKTGEDVSTHWESEHAENRDGDAATARPFKCCSIYLPVMSVSKGEASFASASARRVGAIQVEAYIEDMGPMSEKEVQLADEMRVPRIVNQSQRRSRFGIDGGSRDMQDSSLPAQREVGTRRQNEAQESDEVHIVESSSIVAGKDLGELRSQLLQERESWIQRQKMEHMQWKKRAEEVERARMDELEEEWARREEERSALLKAAQSEYQNLERKLRVTLGEVESRERKLALAEAALDRDKRMFREDTELLRKRLHTEQSHSLSLAQKQVEALEKQVTELQGKLLASEKRSLQIEEDFAEYRKQQRRVPETKLREEIAGLNAQIAELEKAKASEARGRIEAESNMAKMRLQLEKMAKLVQVEKKKNETRVVEELEQLRLKYIAREERYVLDGDREELRAIKKQLDELRRVHVSGHRSEVNDRDMNKAQRQRQFRDEKFPLRDHVSSSSKSVPRSSPRRQKRRQSWNSSEMSMFEGSSNSSDHDENAPSNSTSDHELRRLERERRALLASGVYTEDSFLIRELERRIVLRQEQLQTGRQ